MIIKLFEMKKYLDIKYTLHKTFAFIGTLLFSAGVFAQSISGNVSSEDGPLPGATVVVKGMKMVQVLILTETLQLTHPMAMF